MQTLKRVPSGIHGLDRLLEGGFREKTVIVLVGSSGTGKTTFTIQFAMHGLERGEQALYVTLEESPDQLIHEAELMGFNLREHLDKGLFFLHLRGQNFKKMIEEQLPALVKARSEFQVPTRVIIDPMTPVIWATPDKLALRELIGKLFSTVRQLGVVLATVEEHARPGETTGEDVLLPIYLGDGAIHLEYYPVGGAFNRTLQILKMRGVHHGEGVYPYIFARGVGIVVRAAPVDVAAGGNGSHRKVFEDAVRTAESLNAPPLVIAKIKAMAAQWDYDYSPEEALQIVFDSYGLRRAG